MCCWWFNTQEDCVVGGPTIKEILSVHACVCASSGPMVLRRKHLVVFWLRLYPWYTCLQWPNGVQGKRFWLHFDIPGDMCVQLPNGFAEELFCCILAATVSLRQVPPVSQLCSRESILVAFFVRVCVCVRSVCVRGATKAEHSLSQCY